MDTDYLDDRNLLDSDTYSHPIRPPTHAHTFNYTNSYTHGDAMRQIHGRELR
jgi:hypothetical protein